ncbi:ABC-type transport auxiliary lipoprotein family protein [Polaromonas sp.]|uniref:ABC-type transport auxiliary lipoprotein family protein n=1 Tax=Polaromonas sp. TaxID=1869339 RepID=UPI003520C0F3
MAALLLGACSALPDKPTRAALYDFGPGPLSAQPTTRQAPLPPLALADISTPGGVLDNQAVLYRLAYADAQNLRPYSKARWSMPPAQLVRQRLRETLSRNRAVLNAGEGPALNRGANQGVLPRVLQLELEEFSHLFDTPTSSVGLVRLRATLVETTPTGEKLLAQRNFTVQRPATSADAPGGVRALTAATDAAIEEISTWLQQAP